MKLGGQIVRENVRTKKTQRFLEESEMEIQCAEEEQYEQSTFVDYFNLVGTSDPSDQH